MYYKIVSDGEIIDVCDGLNFVRWQSKNNMLLKCTGADDATGIISSDGSAVYLLEGAAQISDYPYVSYTEITEEEYADYHGQLVENGVLEDTEDSTSASSESESTTEAVKKSSLLLQVEALRSQVDLLIECILELSGEVYSG